MSLLRTHILPAWTWSLDLGLRIFLNEDWRSARDTRVELRLGVVDVFVYRALIDASASAPESNIGGGLELRGVEGETVPV